MEEVQIAAEARPALERLRGWAGILPGKFVFATPDIYKEAYPNQPEKWPKFKFKPYDGLDLNEDLDNTEIYQSVEGRSVKISGKYRVHSIKQGCKDWKDYADDDGNLIPCSKDESGNITDEAIRALPPDMQNWILTTLARLDQVSKAESDGLKF